MLHHHSPLRRRLSALVLPAALLLVSASCRRGPASAPDADPTSAPARPGLSFAVVPPALRLNKRFELQVRVNDGDGRRDFRDHRTEVTVEVSTGTGTLRGTRTRRVVGGLARFDDLRYDRWEEIVLTVRAGTQAPLSTGRIPVRPVLRFTQSPPYRARAQGPLGPLALELVDGQGNLVEADLPITLTSSDPGARLPGGMVRPLTKGRALFDGLVLSAEGPVRLTFTAPGIAPTIHALTAYSTRQTETVWLPGGRVGIPYRAHIGPRTGRDHRLTQGALPRGLRLSPTGELTGTPKAPTHARFEVVSIEADKSAHVWTCDLSIFPERESPAVPRLDDLDRPGPFAVTTWDGDLGANAGGGNAGGANAGRRRLRVYHPEAKDQARRFPVVVFHHGLAPVDPEGPPPYLRFAPLLGRWASYGFVVASVDGLDLIWAQGGYTGDSFNNLKLISENQRAAIAALRALARDKQSPLAGLMDMGRILVAGHSRGAAASLITLRADPALLGGILLRPPDPLITAGGEPVWKGHLPAKPLLLGLAGSDVDVLYPVADFLYERRAGPMSAHTILGTVHGFSCTPPCGAEEDEKPQITREQDWAVTNAYAVAFLSYVGGGDLAYAPLVFGREALSTRLSPLGVLARADRAAAGATIIVEDFQDDTDGRNRLDLPSGTRGMTVTERESWLADAARPLGLDYPFVAQVYARPENQTLARGLRLEWEDAAREKSPAPLYFAELGGLDVRGRGAFVFRALGLDQPIAGAKLTLRFRDGRGRTVALNGADHAGLAGIGPRFSDVIVPLTALAEAELDLGDLERFELELAGAGKMMIDDLRFE